MTADFEQQARSPGSNWPKFYANEIVERYAASTAPSKDTLALYYFDSCPLCKMVRADIELLGVDVELRNIMNGMYR